MQKQTLFSFLNLLASSNTEKTWLTKNGQELASDLLTEFANIAEAHGVSITKEESSAHFAKNLHSPSPCMEIDKACEIIKDIKDSHCCKVILKIIQAKEEAPSELKAFVKNRKTVMVLKAVDSHTMGEPTRIVIRGFPEIPGETMAEKKQYLEQNMDKTRTALMHEPRGHTAMFGAILVPPISKTATFGAIFMDGGGYLNMCGHGTIGSVTISIETGRIKATEPYTYVDLDAPAGLVKAKALVMDGKVKEVSFVNVPSFLYKGNVSVEIPEYGKIILDIAFGGSFFAIVNIKQFGMTISPSNSSKLAKLGLQIREIVNSTIEIKHPILHHIKSVDLVEMYDDATHPEATLKNVVVFGQGQVDRSPCGTGTCAKLATLHAKGKINEGETFVYESILGTLFKGKVVGTTKVGDFDAIIPEITGSSFITGVNKYVIYPEDPLGNGFVLQ